MCDVYRILKPDAAHCLAMPAMLFRGFKDVGVRTHVLVCVGVRTHVLVCVGVGVPTCVCICVL